MLYRFWLKARRLGGTCSIAGTPSSAFFNEIRLRRVKYGFAMWNSYAVKYLLRKCEEANFISHRTKWDISQFSQENYFTFGNAEYFTKFKSCIFVLWAQQKAHRFAVCFLLFKPQAWYIITRPRVYHRRRRISSPKVHYYCGLMIYNTLCRWYTIPSELMIYTPSAWFVATLLQYALLTP